MWLECIGILLSLLHLYYISIFWQQHPYFFVHVKKFFCVLNNYHYVMFMSNTYNSSEALYIMTQYINIIKILVKQATKTHSNTAIMKSTKVQTLGGIWWKYWNIWIENTFACIRIIVLGIYRTSFQHNSHCFINACVHVVNVSNKPV